MKKTLLALASLTLVFSTAAFAADNHWIGGDQSAAAASLSTFHQGANWSLGAEIKNDNKDNLLIDTDGDYAHWTTSGSSFTLQGTLTIGSTNHPAVEVVFDSTRSSPPTNSKFTQIKLKKKVSLLGTNTTIRVNAGVCLGFVAENNALELGEGVHLCGNGILGISQGVGTIPPHDYDALWLDVGNEGKLLNASLGGDISTTGRLSPYQTGSKGVNGLCVLHFNGHTAEVGEVCLGQGTGFGVIDLGGGTLDVAGDFYCLANPDGFMSDNVTPLTSQNGFSSGGHGGALFVGGSFTNILTRSAEGWILDDIDLVLDGDGGKTQELELLSDDFGDTANACAGNFFWKSITLGPNAAVRLVDVCDNSRRTTGPECLYVGTLTIPENATLYLEGHTVYVAGDIVQQGNVVANGGRIVQLETARPFATVTRLLGTPGQTPSSKGYWTGSMVVGDMDGDGNNELVVATIDGKTPDPEELNGDDSRFYVLRYNGAELSDVAPFPVHDSAIGTSSMYSNFLVDDLGNGPRLLFCSTGYTRVRSLDISGNVQFVAEDDDIHYGPAPYLICDINRDGKKEIITTKRSSSKTLRVYDPATQERLWYAPIDANSTVQAYCGVADLDGDLDLEIFSVASGAGASYGLSAFHHDGTPYFAEQPLHFTATVGESFGGVSAADVTGDGIPEFIFAGSKGEGLTILAQNGTELFHATNCKDSNGFALLDVDRDGVYEILHGDTLYKGDGTVLQTLPTPSASHAISQTLAPVLADFNGDQVPEAVYLFSYNNEASYSRYVTVYDFVSGTILPGFPRLLAADLLNPAEANWRAGQFDSWSGSTILVADLDKDGTWEIVVGVGVLSKNTAERPTLNIIDTPYRYELPAGRTPEEAGWYSYRHDSIGSFRYPLHKQMGTILLLW